MDASIESVSIDSAHETIALTKRLYAALAAFDRAELDTLLHPEFVGVLAVGMPYGVGGRHDGADAMRRHGWGAIGKHFIAHADAETFSPLTDGRVLVTGRYVGRGRNGGSDLEAPFAHVITAEGGQIRRLEQYTDTHRWHCAMPPTADGARA